MSVKSIVLVILSLLNEDGSALDANNRRSWMARFILAGVVLLSNVSTRLAIAQTQKAKERRIALLERPSSKAHWEEILDLGELQAGKPITLDVELVNNCNRELRFDGFDSHCVCTIASKTINSLKPKASEKIQLKITPQQARRSAKQSASFSLFNSEGGIYDRLVVVCKYEVSAFLDFSQPHYQVKLREWQNNSDFEPIRLPFTFTKPNQLKNLRVEGTGAFKDFSFEVAAEGGEGRVLLPLKYSDIPKAGMYGTIRLSDTQTGALGQCQLVVKRMGEFEFSPQTLLMVLDDDEGNFSTSGTLVLNVNPKGAEFFSTENPLDVDVRVVSGFGCKATAKRMDVYGRVHRIVLTSVGMDEIAPEKNKVTLFFTCAGTTFEHACEVLFLE